MAIIWLIRYLMTQHHFFLVSIPFPELLGQYNFDEIAFYIKRLSSNEFAWKFTSILTWSTPHKLHWQIGKGHCDVELKRHFYYLWGLGYFAVSQKLLRNLHREIFIYFCLSVSFTANKECLLLSRFRHPFRISTRLFTSLNCIICI